MFDCAIQGEQIERWGEWVGGCLSDVEHEGLGGTVPWCGGVGVGVGVGAAQEEVGSFLDVLWGIHV